MKNNRPTIYLETSIIAAYFDFWGKSNEQSKVTKDFWQKQMSKYEPIISTITIAELQEVKQDWQKAYFGLIQNIETLELSSKAASLAKRYIKAGIVPKNKVDDALHLSLAVTEKIDFFLTWNMKHFLRPHKMKQIIDFNQKYKLYLPTLVKPSDFVN
ncbi:MAG: PIN domain-containing protein [bacterium]|nr:PIN domain-containing protein [bacterium]